MSQQSGRPLSLGNVISIGTSLYKSHLKSYFGVSLKAHLWSLIPIYGWAKFHTLSASIARHAFGELSSQPESLVTTQNRLSERLWLFFVLQLLVGLILFAASMGLNIVQFIVIGLPVSLLLGSSDTGSGVAALAVFLQIIGQIGFYIAYLWIWARVFIPELPFATEEEVDVVQAISRSWDLSKGASWRILLIISVVVLMTMPLYILAMLPSTVMVFSMIPMVSGAVNQPGALEQFVIMLVLALIVGVILFIAAGALVMPLWQSLKASIYYDLRARREGLGLELRDRSDSF